MTGVYSGIGVADHRNYEEGCVTMKRGMTLLLLAALLAFSAAGCKKNQPQAETAGAVVETATAGESAGTDDLQTESVTAETEAETETVEVMSTEVEYNATESEAESEDLRGVIVGS